MGNVQGNNPLSATEALLTPGGDYTLTASGDLAIIRDTPHYPYATVQRVIFLILSNPRIPNLTNTAVGIPDDIIYPDYGSGARAFIGRPNSPSNQNIEAMQRNILSALGKDPFISQNPRPQVSFSSPDNYQSTVLCTVTFQTISGQNATVTDIPVSGGSR